MHLSYRSVGVSSARTSLPVGWCFASADAGSQAGREREREGRKKGALMKLAEEEEESSNMREGPKKEERKKRKKEKR